MTNDNPEQLLKRLKDEYDRDVSAFSETKERMEYDLRMSMGSSKDHWDKNDDINRGSQRAKLAIPVLNKYVDRVVGSYSASPFGIVYTPNTSNPEAKNIAKVKQSVVRGIEEQSKAVTAYMGALKHSASCGYGYFYLTTKDVNNLTMPAIEWIDDPRAVVFDRNSRKPDGSDAERAYYATTMSYSEAKRQFGADVKDAHGMSWMPDANLKKDSDDCQLVFVWEKNFETKTTNVYKIVGNKLVDEFELKTSKLPIFRVAGRMALIGSKPQFISIIHNAVGAQKMLDYSASMTLERLARSPIPSWVAPIEAVGDDLASWSTANTNNASIRTYREYTQDGKPITKPFRDNEAVNLSDVVQVMQTFTQFIDQIVGVPSAEKVSNETAEAALIRKRESEQGEAEIFQHLADAIVCCGECLNELLSDIMVSPRIMPVKDGKELKMLEVDNTLFQMATESVGVEAGPLMRSERKEKLTKALAMQPILGADSKLLWGAIAENVDDIDEGVAGAMKIASEAHAQMITAVANPNDAEALNQQLMQTQEQMAQMQASLDQANLYVQQQDAKIFALEQNAEATILKAQMDNDTKVLIERIKQAGADQRLIAEINAEYQAQQQKYMAEVAKTAASAPKFEIVEGVKPDYTSVGGMRNREF